MAKDTTWSDLSRLTVCVCAVGVAANTAGATYEPKARACRAPTAVGAATSDGYLALLGPAPLRFQETPPPALHVALPPLAMTNEVPREVSPPAAPPVPCPAAPPADTAVDPFEWSWLSTDPSEAPGTAPAAAPDLWPAPPEPPPATAPTLITPQMLLEYFQPLRAGTNGPATLSVPVQFYPPTPLPAPSSRATYRVE
jgi:hypothetical protein